MDTTTPRCDRCGGPVEPYRAAAYDDLDDDTHVERLCEACAAGAPQTTPAHTPDDDTDKDEGRSAAETLDEILREVKSIRRNQTYTEFSVWNILGGLVQCGVLLVLFLTALRGAPPLLWALILQTMALTFFLLAKE